METVEPSTWPYLAGGLICTVAGWALRAKSSLDGLCRLLGSGAATEREHRWIPLTLLCAGVSWLFMWGSAVFPFTGGQRPFLVVILTVVLTPAAALAFVGVLSWLVLLRRAAK